MSWFEEAEDANTQFRAWMDDIRAAEREAYATTQNVFIK